MRIQQRLREHIVAAIALDDPLSLHETLRIELLAGRQMVMSSAGSASELNVQVQRLFERQRMKLKPGPAAPQLASMMTLVSAGLGVALLPASAAVPLRPGVRYMPVSGDEAYIDAFVVRRQERLPPAQAMLLRFCCSQVFPGDPVAGRDVAPTERQHSSSTCCDQQ